MSELHTFLFDGLPVRGMIVRLDQAWQEVLARRASNTHTGAYPAPVAELLGEMTAAAALMQANIKFKGSLILQIFGDGPVKMAVAEAQPDLGVRATATVVGEVTANARLPELVNVGNKGRCAITLDPKDRQPGQQPYQGVVPLFGDHGEKLPKLSDVLQHYMLQSEQLDTTLVLAADSNVAAGLLIQRLPVAGEGNLAGTAVRGGSRLHGEVAAHPSSAEGGNAPDAPVPSEEDEIGKNEDYNRIAILAASLTREELLTLDVETILRRLFWEEKLLRFEPRTGMLGPHFHCTCSRERVAHMIRSLGTAEAESILAERGEIEVGCDFCGNQYRFDAVDTAQIFMPPGEQMPGSSRVQ